MPGNDANTELLLHFNGADGNNTDYGGDDSTNNLAITKDNAGTQLDTAQAKFGTASLLLNNIANYVYPNDAGSAVALGAGDWAIDFWMRIDTSVDATAGMLVDGRTGTTSADKPTIQVSAGRVLLFIRNNTTRITGTTVLTANAWHHVAVTRVSGTTRMFLNGTQEGSDFADGVTYLGGNLRPIIGADGNGNNGIAGCASTDVAWMDEFRISVGNGRWSANFTPPTEEYDDEPEPAVGVPIWLVSA